MELPKQMLQSSLAMIQMMIQTNMLLKSPLPLVRVVT
jgi:hypothetical protein